MRATYVILILAFVVMAQASPLTSFKKEENWGLDLDGCLQVVVDLGGWGIKLVYGVLTIDTDLIAKQVFDILRLVKKLGTDCLEVFQEKRNS
ncbi:unnamed protein product [Moneuplotes crassus]|uniref:Uncharacterized protein n=1 Tax=Euplotes crassus TaxID=5936 RepID=A0AAD2D841_EUPCR|nr:unnamed protein product [Moneuplotes crassus]CAI2384201.1 unnamed protein product [Moneuplotes crassus]